MLMQGNISLVPRAMKAIEVMQKAGWRVDIVMANRHPRWKQLDEGILQQLNVKYTYLPLRRQDSLLKWTLSSVLNKSAEIIASVISGDTLDPLASNKVNSLYKLWYNLSSQGEYDLVYGFNSVLWPAARLAQKLGVKFAFDMEDYHPLENIYHRNKAREIARRERLLVKWLPKAAFVSYAAPMIQQKTEELLRANGVTPPPAKTINNTFLASDFPLHNIHNINNINNIHNIPAPLRLVWFSQTISFERGLEQLLPALEQYGRRVRLTLIGNLDPKFYDEFLSPYSSYIEILPAMPQPELHRRLSSFDVGLAIEQTGLFKDNGNKELVLSNKIFAYLLSGLYILATDTPAQREFVTSHPACGQVCGQSSEAMTAAIGNILDNIDAIRAAAPTRHAAAIPCGWESEKGKLLSLLTNLEAK